MANRFFREDYERFAGKPYSALGSLGRLIKNYDLRILWLLRQWQQSKGLRERILFHLLYNYGRKYGIELVCKNLGGGVRLIHPFGITVNGGCVLGKNVTLYKGCTIGEILNGKRKGVPTIGNNVTIYPNATVCGKVHIGDNVLIASGAWVDFDVPDNCTVIGNPGIIHKKT